MHSALTPNPSPSGRGEPEAPLRESRFWKPDLVSEGEKYVFSTGIYAPFKHSSLATAFSQVPQTSSLSSKWRQRSDREETAKRWI
jgi:hypothetical protein